MAGALEYSDGNTWRIIGIGTGTVTSITAGTGLTGGTIASNGTIALANTAVTAGVVAFPASITFNQQGQATSVAAGVPPVTAVTGTANQVSVTANTTTPVISLPSSLVTPGSVTTTGDVTINSTGFLKIPVGNSSNRPLNPTAGMIRYNTDL